jgi:hypothetical protein
LSILIWECESFFAMCRAIAEDLAGPNRPSVHVHVQGALDFTANIAKILWGRSRRGSQEAKIALARAKRLRKRLGMTRNRVLNNTLLRNALQHIDERLDEWGQTTTSFNIAKFGIETQGTVNMPNMARFMMYDPQRNEVRMLQLTVNLQDVYENVSLVYVRAQAASREIEKALFQPPQSP